jgi:uncharacterized protein with HEPN domain
MSPRDWKLRISDILKAIAKIQAYTHRRDGFRPLRRG